MRRFGRDPLKSEIESYGKLPLRLYKQLDGDIRFPYDPLTWWTHVGLRSAAAGAAIALGTYRLVLGARAESGEPLDRFTALLNDGRAMRAAYRVLAWAYMAEITAELWAPHYDVEMREARGALPRDNPHEEEVRDSGRALLQAAESEEERELRLDQFRSQVLAAMIAAATASEGDAQTMAPVPETSAWLDCYRQGRETAAARLRELAPSDLPTLSGR
jgi:hypothetical protein